MQYALISYDLQLILALMPPRGGGDDPPEAFRQVPVPSQIRALSFDPFSTN
jgi:hypothetical protein